MKNKTCLKSIFVILLILIWNVSVLQSKDLKDLKIEKASLKGKLNIPSGHSIVDINSLGDIMVYEPGQGVKLMSTKSTDKLRKALPKVYEIDMTKYPRQRPILKFAHNDRFTIYKKGSGPNATAEIYDTVNRKTETINVTDDGDINWIDVYDLNNILYESYSDQRRPKVYLRKDKDHIFIAEGGVPIWSPNGMWFLISQYAEPMSLMEIKGYGLTNEKMQTSDIKKIKLHWCIYNNQGQKILKLENLKNIVDWSNWALDSKKLVCEERSTDGFIIYYFNDNQNEIKTIDTYRFAGFSNPPNLSTRCISPTWSPDGSFVAFFKVTEDSDRVLETRLYLYDDRTKNIRDIGSLCSGLGTIKWLSPNQVLVRDCGDILEFTID